MKKLRLTRRDQARIRALRERFPEQIHVRVRRSEDGGFCAEITTFPGCITEADTFSELLDMINDGVRTIFEVPDAYLAYMLTYLPTMEMAQKFNAFPSSANTQELILQAPIRLLV
jgi:predicted RNase H-like HicB family nuclease